MPGTSEAVRGLRHLPGDDLLRLPQPGPVVVGQPKRHLDMQDVEQLDKVVGPAGRNRARAHGIFEGQVPADNPGEDLAQGGIGIGVGAARQRNHGGEFRIAQCREGATQSGKNEGKHQGRAGVVRSQARHHKNAGADDRAHPERSQLEGSERALQTVFAAFLGLIEQRVQRLFRQQIRHACVYPFIAYASASADSQLSGPHVIHRNAQQNNDQSRPGVLRLVAQ